MQDLHYPVKHTGAIQGKDRCLPRGGWSVRAGPQSWLNFVWEGIAACSLPCLCFLWLLLSFWRQQKKKSSVTQKRVWGSWSSWISLVTRFCCRISVGVYPALCVFRGCYSVRALLLGKRCGHWVLVQVEKPRMVLSAILAANKLELRDFLVSWYLILTHSIGNDFLCADASCFSVSGVSVVLVSLSVEQPFLSVALNDGFSEKSERK